MLQVNDNLSLLEQMLEDTRNAPDVYRPTNYWKNYEKKFLPELKTLGLHDFRRRKKTILTSFGATDLTQSTSFLFKNRIFNNMFTRKIINYSKYICRFLPISPDVIHKISDKTRVKPINNFEASLFGNPEDVIRINDKVYTSSILYFYLRYAYCCNFIDFDDVNVIVELGSGSGKQIEVLKKLHPNISFLLFDIPPQLYVCEQYLSAVFPDSLISYETTRNFDSIPNLKKGGIYIMGTWKFPLLKQLNVDLFWNTSSFQEMEPEVVANYLNFVNNCSSSVYLKEKMSGKEVAKTKGEHGVLNPTTIEDYRKGLKNFTLTDISPSLLPTGTYMGGYSDSFWKRT